MFGEKYGDMLRQALEKLDTLLHNFNSEDKEFRYMSASLDRLAADVKAATEALAALKANDAALAASNATLTASVTDLTAQVATLKAESGTPDAQLDALSAELEAANPPVAPAPEPDPVVTTA